MIIFQIANTLIASLIHMHKKFLHFYLSKYENTLSLHSLKAIKDGSVAQLDRATAF